MRNRLAGLLILVSLAAAPSVTPRVVHAAATPPLANLSPSTTDLRIQQTVDVNVVFMGFGGVVNPATVLAQPPVPSWNGVPQANGAGQTFIGQRFDFRYHAITVPAWLEDAIFGLLREVAVPQEPVEIFSGLPPMPITPAQALYNYCNLDPAVDPGHGCSFDPAAPRVNRRLVTQNYLLSAPWVEKVLSQNLGPLLGVDVTRPTIVLMNWWGRPDYVDHIYLDPSEPDPETGAPLGYFFENELAGYGGTSNTDPETCGQGDCIFHRLWFYDISAGPMQRTGGFDLVSDVPRFIVSGTLSSGGPHYRFHHTADYNTPAGTYRPINTMVTDVARLIGGVFVSEIAYAGPLYPPGLTPPLQPHHLVLNINRWSWDGQPFQLDAPRMIGKMNALPYDFSAAVTDQAEGPDSNIGRVWKCSLTGAFGQLGQSCYGNRSGGYAIFGDLENYFTDHLFQYLTGAPDYEVPIFQFNVPPELAQPAYAGAAIGTNLGLGWTSTQIRGTRQSFVFTSTTPDFNAFYGHGRLLEHEVGHHLGFSHPFMGYRCTTESCDRGNFVPFGGNELTWFSMAGQYVTGLMTYVRVNNDYSRFELDNLQRWLTWQYLDLSNFIVAQLTGSPRVGSVTAAVVQADARAGAALAAYQSYNYAGAVQEARAAYNGLVAAADAINVKLSPQAYQAVRRNPADFNQAIRDYIEANIGDPADAMSGAISADGVPGLEGITLVAPSTPLAVTLPTPANVALRR